ncbi:hypothetical protein [Ewingella americana]
MNITAENGCLVIRTELNV